MDTQVIRFVDAGIPPKLWGRDHWSTFAFVAHWCMESGGAFNITEKAAQMRTDYSLHPEYARMRLMSQDGGGYPTRLKGGKQKRNHDDWSCLEDLERHGLVVIEGIGVHPEVLITDLGLDVSGKLNAHKTRGGSFADFDWAP